MLIFTVAAQMVHCRIVSSPAPAGSLAGMLSSTRMKPIDHQYPADGRATARPMVLSVRTAPAGRSDPPEELSHAMHALFSLTAECMPTIPVRCATSRHPRIEEGNVCLPEGNAENQEMMLMPPRSIRRVCQPQHMCRGTNHVPQHGRHHVPAILYRFPCGHPNCPS